VLVDVGGVGYDVAISLGTFSTLPAVGERVTLQIHTHVREDSFQLFGFLTPLDRTIFERLLSVSGIGPRLALTILSGSSLSELINAIVSQDTRRLATIPGIGKKLAERLCLELKDKLKVLAGSPAAQATDSRAGTSRDAIGALINLGYREPAAEEAVSAALREAPSSGLSDLIQRALKSLVR
jgi:Holliday junction DNA helicase RuvA